MARDRRVHPIKLKATTWIRIDIVRQIQSGIARWSFLGENQLLYWKGRAAKFWGCSSPFESACLLVRRARADSFNQPFSAFSWSAAANSIKIIYYRSGEFLFHEVQATLRKGVGLITQQWTLLLLLLHYLGATFLKWAMSKRLQCRFAYDWSVGLNPH